MSSRAARFTSMVVGPTTVFRARRRSYLSCWYITTSTRITLMVVRLCDSLDFEAAHGMSRIIRHEYKTAFCCKLWVIQNG